MIGSVHPLRDDLESIQQRAAPGLWEGLRGQTVFLTGGTGFFGWWLVESFVHLNRSLGLDARMVVLTRDPARFGQRHPHLAAEPSLRFAAGDVRTMQTNSVLASLGAGPSHGLPLFIHGATSSDARDYERDPFGALETIVMGTRAALTVAREAGTRRFLFLSSGAVYGSQPPELAHLPETFRAGAPDCTDVGSLYGEGKRVAEMYCACAHQQYGVETVLARAFAFVGPGLPLDQHFAIGNFLGDALAGRPIEIKGDGTPFRSYLYASDLALWLWTLLLRGAAGRVYNVGSDQAMSLAQVAAAVARGSDAHQPVPVRIARPADPGSPAARYVPDVTRIKTELGVQETCDLDAAIQRTLAWHRSR